MNENINLCKILKGHEGKTFYSRAFGYIKLEAIENDVLVFLINTINYIIGYNYDGRIECTDAEQDLFPSKDQRDWEKWDKENNHETPKTWSELIKDNEILLMGRATSDKMYEETEFGYPIEKSASALLKIHQLIEFSYGGNVTNEEWIDDDWKYVIGYYSDEKEFPIITVTHTKYLIAFHRMEQAKEFLSYPENIKLLQDYYML